MAIQTVGNFGNAMPQPAAPQARSQPEAPALPKTAAGEPQAAPRQTKQPSREQIEQAVEEMRRSLQDTHSTSLQFSIDDSTNLTLVRVVDSKTGDVIRQIPSEEILAIARSLDRMQGLLLRQQA